MPPDALRRFALSALLVLTACGGSGGGGGAPVVVVLSDGTFQGTYFVVLGAGRATGGTDATASTGTLTADGAGSASHTFTLNDFGAVSGPTTYPYDYDVAADGSLELRVLGTPLARGGISSDGECALTASIAPGALPGILVFRRRGGFYTLSSLSGAYHFVLFETTPFGGSTFTGAGNVLFDGVGGGSVTLTANAMGVIFPSGPGAASYTMIGDGTSTLSTGGDDMEGGVVSGGDAGIWAGGTTGAPGSAPSLAVVVKEATSAGLNTLQGAYWIVLLERDPGTGEFRSLHGTATANGAGSLTLLSTANTEGTITVEPPQAATYTVTATGKLTVDAGGSILLGGVSQDGRFAVLGGGTNPGSSPTIAILCRK